LVDLTPINPAETPYVFLLNSFFSIGQVGDTENPDETVDVVIQKILYVPHGAEPGAPAREMLLVFPIEYAADIAKTLQQIPEALASTQTPSTGDKA
jgi:hypothetical protein